ncbi:NUDIX hydrolase [Paenibacillus silagei]|uniref:ADP-ribose pyrophosphatase YjhB (NUDIX family) n=1 Tax=Paenibacillus silagei TaxID=1670801 RepID=A0ABS4NPF4_9BACL|nr:NUDIX domain-containing protein [Paenibacillus silagei]MBP2111222.1 ADP-ribose pyrophosphatase YjhB (NUDIX family) [Paenibacillus silagei]
MQIYRKVLAYITYNDKLLVFTHRDAPEAGVQVPAGTVEPDESVEDALYREIAEESGIEQQELRLVKHLKTYLYYAEHKQQRHERHVYWLEFVHEPLPAWEHRISAAGEDAGLVFDYYWVPVQEAVLAGGQGYCLDIMQ